VESDPHAATPLGALVSLSEALSQEVDDMARTALGWPVPLRGTGIAFRREILQEFSLLLCTRAEDLELSLLLTRSRIPVVFLPEAIVYDPKPAEVASATKQRARWLQGHWEVVRRYWRDILMVFKIGSWGERALLFSLLLRPRTLVIGAKATVLFSAVLLVTPLFPRLVLLVGAGVTCSLLVDLIYYCAGSALLAGSHTKNPLWRGALYLPIWAGAIVLSLFSTKKWLSVRDRSISR
jgi:cellulose synthase/poly-beta-1,6-N-acetylglucosamine synthase-like glycosyltransferase